MCIDAWLKATDGNDARDASRCLDRQEILGPTKEETAFVSRQVVLFVLEEVSKFVDLGRDYLLEVLELLLNKRWEQLSTLTSQPSSKHVKKHIFAFSFLKSLQE